MGSIPDFLCQGICLVGVKICCLSLQGLAMIFAGQENQFIIFRSKDIYIYFKTNNKIPINLLK